jgi:hypothetical protein
MGEVCAVIQKVRGEMASLAAAITGPPYRVNQSARKGIFIPFQFTTLNTVERTMKLEETKEASPNEDYRI